MRSIILLSALLFACRGDTDDSSDGVDSDTFRPAIDESPEPDRVGTYAHTLPESPKTVIFLGDSITAGAGAGPKGIRVHRYNPDFVQTTNTFWVSLSIRNCV